VTSGLGAMGQNPLPKWKEFGMPVQFIENKFGWDKGTVVSTADELGWVVVDDWVCVHTVVNDTRAKDLDTTKARAIERTLKTSGDKMRKMLKAPQVLKPNCVAPKAIPHVRVEWLNPPLGVKKLLDVVKGQLKETEPRRKSPDAYWNAVCTSIYALAQQEGGVCPNFRFKFEFEQVDVQQLKTGQMVTTEVSLTFQDYTMGVCNGVLGPPVRLCSVIGSDKRWNSRVLKNGLLKTLFPTGVPVMFSEEADWLKNPTPSQDTVDALKKKVFETYFAVGKPSTESCYEEVVQTKSAQSRTPIISDSDQLVFKKSIVF